MKEQASMAAAANTLILPISDMQTTLQYLSLFSLPLEINIKQKH